MMESQVLSEASVWKSVVRSVPLILIVLLAGILRFGQPGIVEFKFDEAEACSYAQRIVTGQEFPLADGNMSFGLPDPALDVYLYAVPMLFSDTPLAAVLFVAGLNLLAVAGTYLLAERFFNRRAALFAALFYATAPWAVIYGRKAWVHVQPLLTILMLWFLCQAVCGRTVQDLKQRQPWGVAGFLFLLGLQGQTHLLAVLFLPAAALSLLVFRKRIAERPFWLGLGLAVLVSLPYLAHILSQVPVVQAAVTGGPLRGQWHIDAQAWRFVTWIASGFNLEALLGVSAGRFALVSQALVYVHYAVSALLVLGVALAARTVWRGERGWEAHLIVLFWLFGPLLLLTARPAPVYLHYMTALFPAVFLVLGVAADWMAGRFRAVAIVTFAVVLLIVGVQVFAVWSLYDHVRAYDTSGGFGVPLETWLAAREVALQAAQEVGTSQVAVVTDGTVPYWDERPAIVSCLLRPEVEPRFLGRGGISAFLLPAGQPLVYLTTRDDRAIAEVLETWGDATAHVPLPGGAGSLSVYLLPAQPTEEIFAQPTVPLGVRFANGAVLMGYDGPDAVAPGETLRLATYWTFRGLSSEVGAADYTAFHHLVDAEGRKWGQQDGFGLASADWREGDVLVQLYDISVSPDAPPGDYWLWVGLYSLRDGTRVAVLDEIGSLVGDRVVFGPFHVGP